MIGVQLPEVRLRVRDSAGLDGVLVLDVELRGEAGALEVASFVTAGWLDRPVVSGRLDDEDLAVARGAGDIGPLLNRMATYPSPNWTQRLVLLKRLDATAGGLKAAGGKLLYRSERDRQPVALDDVRSDPNLRDELCRRDADCLGHHAWLTLLNEGAQSEHAADGALTWHINYTTRQIVPAKPLISVADSSDQQ